MESQHSPALNPVPYPALRIALLFSGGVVCGRLLSLPAAYWTALFGTCLLAFLIAGRLHRDRLRGDTLTLAVSSYLLLVFCAGGARQSWSEESAARSSPAVLLAGHVWEQVDVSGTLLRVTRSSTGKRHLDLRVHHTLLPGGDKWQRTWKVRVVMDSVRYGKRKPLRPGNILRLRATVHPPPPAGPRNPHQFDYGAYLRSRGITLQAGADTLLSLEDGPPLSWIALRQKAMELLDRNFSEETAPLAKALLLGHKLELDPGERLAFTRVGLSHIMAVSGLHVGFLLAPFWWIIPFFWTLPKGKTVGLVLLLLLLAGYAGLTGFTASVTRASLTGGFLVYARLFHRIRNPVNLTSASAVLILSADPSQLFTPGFQLSFAAVFIILICLPVLQGMVPARIRYRPAGRLLKTAMISVLVPAGLYPLLASYFGEFSLAGPLSNIFALPLLLVVVPTALLWMALSLAAPSAGAWLNIPNDFALSGLSRFAELLAGMEWSWMHAPPPTSALVAAWVLGLACFASLTMPHLRWKWIAALLLLGCLQQGKVLYRSMSPPPLTVLQFDVGQGDASLVRTPGGRNLLVDAGRWEPGYSSARYVLLPYLRAAGIDSLHAVVLTHPHADHIGGMPDLLKAIPVGAIYHPGLEHDSELYRRYHVLAREQGISLRILSAGEELDLDPSLRIHILSPVMPGPGTTPGDPNDLSLVFRLVYGETEMLFTGDAGLPAELQMVLRYGPMLRSDLLKAGHHGAGDATSAPFLRAVRPEYAVISAGVRNPFGHPHPGTLDRLRRLGTRTYLTARDRAVMFRSDGRTIRRVRWR